MALIVEGPPPHLTAGNLIGFGWLATGGTAGAYLLWFRGIAKLPVGQVSLLGLASPVVATLSGWLVLHQTLAAQQLVGGALVLLGTLGSGSARARRQVMSRPDTGRGCRGRCPLVRR